MKPTIGMPSSRVTTAPTAWVPRKANCRRLSRRGSRAIADEPVEDAGGAEDDEEQGHRNRTAYQPEGQRGLPVGLAEPAPQADGGDADEQQGEADHDDADQGQVEVGLEGTHQFLMGSSPCLGTGKCCSCPTLSSRRRSWSRCARWSG